ncbi:MAG: nitroreductase family protein, partial [Bacteroidaceae bacterium]|nr:nitroreductase family protein [Bacteroidaceae bacterium]
LEVARMAPSAVNYQPWQFVVVRDGILLQQLRKVYHREWFDTAPCCIVVCGNHNESWHRASDGKDHCDIDIAIATEHIALAAAECGLGTCWVCNFDIEACAQLLQLPHGIEPMVLMPIGYPVNNEIPEKKRKSIDEIVQWR